jgi:hypothetical protein
MTQSDADPATWGRRPYADVEAREILNDVSDRIARKQPEHVDDPADLSLADVLRQMCRENSDLDTEDWTLAELMTRGLTSGEVVCWWFYRHAGYDLAEIHHAIQGGDFSDDAGHRRNSLRNIQRMLKSAASKLPDEDPGDVPDVIDADAVPAEA